MPFSAKINTTISNTDGYALKAKNLVLCIARRVNDVYAVVTQSIPFTDTSITDFEGGKNIIVDDASFSIYSIQPASSGPTATPTSNKLSIKIGGGATFDGFNVNKMTASTDNTAPGVIRLYTDDPKVRFALSNDNKGENAIYAFDPNGQVGTIFFQPQYSFLVWLGDATTFAVNTVLSGTLLNALEIPLTADIDSNAPGYTPTFLSYAGLDSTSGKWTLNNTKQAGFDYDVTNNNSPPEPTNTFLDDAESVEMDWEF